MVDDNGTHLEGVILDPVHKKGVPGMSTYASRREEAGYYLPWPEWVHPPVNVGDTSGEFVFDCMLSWWSRYIGISPYFNDPIRLIIKDSRIVDIRGGEEAKALQRFSKTDGEPGGRRHLGFSTPFISEFIPMPG